jgi:hypothetical protein
MPERHRFPGWDDHDDPVNAGERYPKEPLTTGELHALDGPSGAGTRRGASAMTPHDSAPTGTDEPRTVSSCSRRMFRGVAHTRWKQVGDGG